MIGLGDAKVGERSRDMTRRIGFMWKLQVKINHTIEKAPAKIFCKQGTRQADTCGVCPVVVLAQAVHQGKGRPIHAGTLCIRFSKETNSFSEKAKVY
jgi:hypothetical protein